MMRIRLSGFTLIELIAVMIIVGVLAVAVLPRFNDKTFQMRGFYDQTLSMLRFAQKAAIAKRRNVCVTIASDVVTLKLDSTADNAVPACTVDLVSPTGNSPFSEPAPSGVHSTDAAFAFTPSGTPNPNAAVAITISASGETNRTITVESDTGYVH